MEKFVEFCGAGLINLPLADRATMGGAAGGLRSTCANLRWRDAAYLGQRRSRRRTWSADCAEKDGEDEEDYDHRVRRRTSTWSVTVVPSIAGPRRPQDRVSLTESKQGFRRALEGFLPDEDQEDEAVSGSFPASDPVSTHVPGTAMSRRAAPAVRRWPIARRHTSRSRSPTAPIPSSTTATW